MDLHPAAREFYVQGITTDPQTTGWEASFDGGATWLPGEDVSGVNDWRWLVHGPEFVPPDGDTEVSILIQPASPSQVVYPLLRCIDNPEVIVTLGTPINIG